MADSAEVHVSFPYSRWTWRGLYSFSCFFWFLPLQLITADDRAAGRSTDSVKRTTWHHGFLSHHSLVIYPPPNSITWETAYIIGTYEITIAVVMLSDICNDWLHYFAKPFLPIKVNKFYIQYAIDQHKVVHILMWIVNYSFETKSGKWRYIQSPFYWI